MQGSVYRLLITDTDDGEPHPHVIVLTFSGNQDCIAIPAYSTDGYKINERIQHDRDRGLQDGQIFVTLDNATEIDFTANYSGKEAFWCVTMSRRLPQRFVLGSKRLGQMKTPAFLKVATALLAWAESGNSDLSGNAIKALRNLIKNLSATEQLSKLPSVSPTSPPTPESA